MLLFIAVMEQSNQIILQVFFVCVGFHIEKLIIFIFLRHSIFNVEHKINIGLLRAALVLKLLEFPTGKNRIES